MKQHNSAIDKRLISDYAQKVMQQCSHMNSGFLCWRGISSDFHGFVGVKKFFKDKVEGGAQRTCAELFSLEKVSCKSDTPLTGEELKIPSQNCDVEVGRRKMAKKDSFSGIFECENSEMEKKLPQNTGKSLLQCPAREVTAAVQREGSSLGLIDCSAQISNALCNCLLRDMASEEKLAQSKSLTNDDFSSNRVEVGTHISQETLEKEFNVRWTKEVFLNCEKAQNKEITLCAIPVTQKSFNKETQTRKQRCRNKAVSASMASKEEKLKNCKAKQDKKKLEKKSSRKISSEKVTDFSNKQASSSRETSQQLAEGKKPLGTSDFDRESGKRKKSTRSKQSMPKPRGDRSPTATTHRGDRVAQPRGDRSPTCNIDSEDCAFVSTDLFVLADYREATKLATSASFSDSVESKSGRKIAAKSEKRENIYYNPYFGEKWEYLSATGSTLPESKEKAEVDINPVETTLLASSKPFNLLGAMMDSFFKGKQQKQTNHSNYSRGCSYNTPDMPQIARALRPTRSNLSPLSEPFCPNSFCYWKVVY